MIVQAVIRAGNVELATARVAGLSLVARAVLTFARAGARRIFVVGPANVADDDVRRAGQVVSIVPEPPVLEGAWLDATADRVYDAARLEEIAGTGRVDAAATATLAPADTKESRREAERLLYRSLRKSVDGPVSRHINRPLSLAVTRLLVGTPITPNQMTVVATIFGVAGVFSVLRATWLGVALGSVLVQLQSVLDGCDGEIARLKFRSSRFGEWLDNVLDDLVNAGYGLALGIASAALLGQELFKWLGIGAAAAIMVYNLVVYTQLAVHHGTGNPFAFRWWFQTDGGDMPGRVSGAVSFFYALARRDVFLFAFMLLALVRLPQLAVLWYAILCAGYLVMSVIHMIRGGMPVQLRTKS